jgi:hypothetical protein
MCEGGNPLPFIRVKPYGVGDSEFSAPDLLSEHERRTVVCRKGDSGALWLFAKPGVFGGSVFWAFGIQSKAPYGEQLDFSVAFVAPFSEKTVRSFTL